MADTRIGASRTPGSLENDRRLMNGFSEEVFPKKDWNGARF